MEIPLSPEEQSWTDGFEKLIKAKPAAITLVIDNQSCAGNIQLFSRPFKSFSKPESKWIAKLNSHLNEFPKTPDFWLLSNIDGWNVGKGKPCFFSGTTVGEGGATGSLRDNFSNFYHYQVEVDYGDVDYDLRDNSEVIEIKSCLGDLNIQNHTDNFL